MCQKKMIAWSSSNITYSAQDSVYCEFSFFSLSSTHCLPSQIPPASPAGGGGEGGGGGGGGQGAGGHERHTTCAV